ncbi:MAG: Fic family protein [Corynebacterium sp.]|nr:Fic family protein [Corynebacterium sp.]
MSALCQVACKLNEKCALRIGSDGRADSYAGYSVEMTRLEGALAAAFQSFDGKHLHQSPYDVAAVLLLGISNNHPFQDGNKRTALQLAVTYLKLHSIELNPSSDNDAVDLVLGSINSPLRWEDLIRHVSDKFREWTQPDRVALNHRSKTSSPFRQAD